MSELNSSPISAMQPPSNLRITFWGVQGSCPISPTREDVDQYSEVVASNIIERTFLDLADQAGKSVLTPEFLRAMAEPKSAAKYRKQIGLTLPPVYGGDTTCVEVETADGDIILFDMGTGLRGFSRYLRSHPDHCPGRTLHVFASHEHLDHRDGLTFSRFCFEKTNPFTVHVHGTRQFLMALDDRYGIYSHRLTMATHVDDPVDYRMISATFTGTEIQTSGSHPDLKLSLFDWPLREPEQPVEIGSTRITPFELYHGSTHCLAYKVQRGSSTFVFCTDHELRHGTDPSDLRQIKSMDAERRLIEQCQDADVAYFDGQYLLDEYLGLKGIGSNPGVPRMDWGHSCIEDVVARSRQCRIGKTFIGHHDPERPWANRVEVDHQLGEVSKKQQPYSIQLAKAGDRIEV